MNIKLKKLKSNKNLLIITGLLVLLIFAFSVIIINKNNHLKSKEKLPKITEKDYLTNEITKNSNKEIGKFEKVENEEYEKNLDDKDEMKIQQSISDSKKSTETKKESIVNNKAHTSDSSNTASNSTISSGNQQNYGGSVNKNEISSSNQSESSGNNTLSTDEREWQEFINSYSTLAILGGNIDFYTASEQEIESNKWVNLGYRTELPRACIYLSSGQRCVYSLRVFAGEGACGFNKSISVNWRAKNYISDLDYLKSMGYSCP